MKVINLAFYGPLSTSLIEAGVFNIDAISDSVEFNTMFNCTEIPTKKYIVAGARSISDMVVQNAPSGVCAVIVPECALYSDELTTRLNGAGFTCFYAIIRGGKFLGFIPARAFC